MPEEDTQGEDHQQEEERTSGSPDPGLAQQPGQPQPQPANPPFDPGYPPPQPGYPPPQPGYPPPHPGYPPPQPGYPPPQPGTTYSPQGFAPGGYPPGGHPAGMPEYQAQYLQGHPWQAPPSIQSPDGVKPAARNRPWKIASVVAAALVVVGLLSWGGVELFGGSNTSGSTAQSSSSAPVSPAARRAMAAAITAAEAAGSFHYVSSSTTTANGATITSTTVGDAGRNSGRQDITTKDPVNGSAAFTVLVVGTTAYFRGDATALAENLNLSASVASQHANQWISLQPSDGSVYSSVYAAVTVHDALAENISVKPQNLSTTTVGTRTIHIVSGALNPVTIPGQGTQRVDGTGSLQIVARTRLPVHYQQSGTSGSGSSAQRTSFTMSFSAYGKPVSVTAPQGAVPYSSIGGSSGGSSSSPTFLT
jgi:hypothetical protein